MPLTEELPALVALCAGLAGHGWAARQGAACSGGGVDLAAERLWRRGELTARVRLIIEIPDDLNPLLLSPTPPPPTVACLPFYTLGDDDPEQRLAITAVLRCHGLDPTPILAALHRAAYRRDLAVITPARVDPPAAPRTAATFRAGSPIADAFRLVPAIRADLLRHDLDVLAGDLPAHVAAPPHCELLHPIVLTAAPLPSRDWLRLERRAVVGAEWQWLDVVHSGFASAFVEMLTAHYEAAYRRRRFEAVR